MSNYFYTTDALAVEKRILDVVQESAVECGFEVRKPHDDSTIYLSLYGFEISVGVYDIEEFSSYSNNWRFDVDIMYIDEKLYKPVKQVLLKHNTWCHLCMGINEGYDVDYHDISVQDTKKSELHPFFEGLYIVIACAVCDFNLRKNQSKDKEIKVDQWIDSYAKYAEALGFTTKKLKERLIVDMIGVKWDIRMSAHYAKKTMSGLFAHTVANYFESTNEIILSPDKHHLKNAMHKRYVSYNEISMKMFLAELYAQTAGYIQSMSLFQDIADGKA